MAELFPELIAYAETAALFAERAATAPAAASGLERQTLEAMARVHGREAADELRLVLVQGTGLGAVRGRKRG